MEIAIAVIIVGIIGLIAGVGLALASFFFDVPADETVEKVRSVLPGANCGACGFSGCDGYAEALVGGEAEMGLCSPGGNEVNTQIGEILGKKAKRQVKKTAVLKCNGTECNTQSKYKYLGANSCTAVNLMFSGDNSCAYGCLGYGDCAAVCKFGAIEIKEGIATINPEKCTACGMCVSACPKGIIELKTASKKYTVKCSNTEKGVEVKKVCKTGCIGCMLCQKACPKEAIKVENNVAKITYSKCNSCGKCAEVCPVKIIQK